MTRKRKSTIIPWLRRGLLILQGLLLLVLFMHPRVPNSARLIVCGGSIAFLVVLFSWSRVDLFLRERLDAYLYERGAPLFVIYVARAVLFLLEFGLAVSIIVPALLKLDTM